MDVKAELARERRARLAAERLLKLRQSELAEANARLGRHAIDLSEQVIETRTEAQTLRHETEDAREKLKHARGETDIAKRRLWASIETIEDGFSVFDSDGRLVIANSAFLSVFDGLDHICPGVGYAQILDALSEEGIVDTGGMQRREWRAMMERRWASPQPDPLTLRLWNGIYLRLNDRRSGGGDTVSLALNITDTVRYQQRLKSAGERAQAASRAKSAFLARMSHELRTPMNGVVGMAELLLEDDLHDEQRLYVETIRSSGEALLELINNILDFSKLEARRETLHPDRFDLRVLMNEIVQLFRPALAARPVDMRLDYPDDVPAGFVGDAGRIRQILTNLIGNAVKFTEEGMVDIAVCATPSSGPDEVTVRFRVRDTGIGIPPDQVEHIFGEFNQIDDQKNRNFEGTGLGLTICRQLTELMNGTIRVESAAGAGSSFLVELPLPLAADGAAPTEPQALADTGAAGPDNSMDMAAPGHAKDREPSGPRRMRILAAEDNKTNRLVFEKMLKPLDIDLDFAENGAIAVFKWRQFRPDLIFMDISMPDVDGIEATRRIRDEEAQRGLPKTPIVALTAHTVTGDREEILAKGLDFYMTKPLRKAEIFEQIRTSRPAGCLPVDGDDAAAAPGVAPNLAATEPVAIVRTPAKDAARQAEAVRKVWDGLNREGSGHGSPATVRQDRVDSTGQASAHRPGS